MTSTEILSFLVLLPIAVAECPSNIEIDQSGNVVGYDVNTVRLFSKGSPGWLCIC